MLMREPIRTAVVTVVVCLAGSWACGDDVEVRFGTKFMHYAGVRITDFEDGQLQFALPGNRTLKKKLSDIKTISIKDLPTFGQAEKNVAAGKNWAQAVKGYDAADKKAKKRWQKRLIAIRRIHALDEGMKTDRAVKEWLSIADTTAGAAWVLSAKPARQAKKGYEVNAAAISILERKRSMGKRSKAYDVAIAEVLMGLYNREGHTSKASALAQWIRTGKNAAGNGSSGNGNGGNGGTAVPRSAGSFETIETLLRDGKADEALKYIEGDLRKYTRAQLPRAMLLRGRAQVGIAAGKDAQAKNALLLKAGLNFMWGVVADPKSPQAPEALYEAGRVHTMLAKPNLRAARAAYRKVIADYASSPAAAKARKALQAIRN